MQCLDRLAYQAYAKPGLVSTKLLYIKDCTKIAAD